jgi:cytochrome c peroxidase
MRIAVTLTTIILLHVVGCVDKVENPTYVPKAYNLLIPKGFPPMTIPEDNPLTEEGVALGRKLYYDKILDENEARACATCHLQDKSFSSAAAVLPHINLGWSNTFLWNGKISGTLEDIMRFEVEAFFKTDVGVLNSHAEYPILFKQAFGVDKISANEIVMALAQFFRIMNSGNSKFDQFLRDEVEFSNQEYLGYELFYTERGDCFHCHATIFMTDNQMHNNALDAIPSPGYFDITGDSLDYGNFKSPTLRNIEFTGPYMHDGRYATLEDIVEFYSTGLQISSTVDPLMKNVNRGGVQLTAEEKAALVAFLKTLSDYDYLTNPELSDPSKGN